MSSNNLRILAIESSCDETSAAVIEGINYPEIKTNIIASQIDIHKITGGVVPEIAAREHCQAIIPTIEKALGGAIHKKIKDIDAIAVTHGPGLVGSLLIGVETAKALAYASGKPLIPINHLEGHIFAALQQKQNYELRIMNYGGKKNHNTYFMIHNTFPALALIVSGGHTMLVFIKDLFDYEIIGQTLDDAAGEAFDKVGTLLGLEYPAGPTISKLADKFYLKIKNDESNYNLKNSNLKIESSFNNHHLKLFKLPRPMLHSKDLNFSFSGLKTAVVNIVHSSQFTDDRRAEIAYEFQEAVVEVLLEKTWQAKQNYELGIMNYGKTKVPIIHTSKYILQSVLLTGGVSANKRLREAFAKRFGDKLLVSPLELCGDNAGMIGLAAFMRLKCKIQNPKSKIQIQNSKIIRKSRILNLKSTFPWQSVNANPNLEL